MAGVLMAYLKWCSVVLFAWSPIRKCLNIYPEAGGGACCLPLVALLTHFPLAPLIGILEDKQTP
jgi:hypothetical protein